MTPLIRELKYACQDVDCGLTFRAELTITHELSPSARSMSGLRLPPLRPRSANDDAAQAAANGG